jgi:hypothetical protein
LIGLLALSETLPLARRNAGTIEEVPVGYIALARSSRLHGYHAGEVDAPSRP